MAKIVLTNPTVIFETTNDFSDFVSSITLSTVHDVLDVTPVQDGVIYKEVIAGVGTNSVSFDFYQDFADNSLEEFFNAYPISRVGTLVLCHIRPNGTAPISASNPEYRFNTLVTEWTPLNASVGQLSTISVSWPVSGSIAKFIFP